MSDVDTRKKSIHKYKKPATSDSQTKMISPSHKQAMYIL